MREQQLVGLEALGMVTALLQRIRAAHPTKGLFEAADLQWWWRQPRPTDEAGQLFWFDDQNRPEAAVIATDWGGQVALAPMLMPDASPDEVAHVIERGVAHAVANGLGAIDLEVDVADDVIREALLRHGFAPAGAADAPASISVVETWLDADARPAISTLHEGYRLARRTDVSDRPHHLAARSGVRVEARLGQTSLYRPDLDLLVIATDGTTAASGLFWFDPVTRTGLVEPMRTEDDHQRRGLARHLLTTGIDLLAEAGAERIKIVFGPDNLPAKSLYLSVGFQPVKRTVVFSRAAEDR